MKRPRCAFCDSPFTPASERVAPQQLYCSIRCKTDAYHQRRLAKLGDRRKGGERRDGQRRKDAA